MIKNFRGHLDDVSFPSSVEPHFDGSDFSTLEGLVPTSDTYKIDDLLAVGKVSPVSTEILHDSSAVEAIVNSPADSSTVEPANK